MKGLETLLRLPGSQKVFCNGKLQNKIQIQKKKKKKKSLVQKKKKKKIHDDCFKNVTASVLTRFSADLAW